MSDDQTTEMKMEENQVQTTTVDQVPKQEERNIKIEPATSNESVVPLSQQPEPPKDSFHSVALRLQQYDEAMLKDKIPFSAWRDEQREEYNKLIEEKKSYINAFHSHAKLLKEEEPDFALENPEEWKDDFSRADGQNYMKAIAYCAASAKMDRRNREENRNLKRRIEELENEKKASPASSSSSSGGEARATGNAVSNFANNGTSMFNTVSTTPQPKPVGNGLGIKMLDKLEHKHDFMNNPTRHENVLGAKLINSFDWFSKPLTSNK